MIIEITISIPILLIIILVVIADDTPFAPTADVDNCLKTCSLLDS